MVSERYEMGPSPHIVVLECTGSLDIRGGDREEVRIQGDEVPCEDKRLKARLAVATSAEERQRLVAKIEAVTRQPFAPASK